MENLELGIYEVGYIRGNWCWWHLYSSDSMVTVSSCWGQKCLLMTFLTSYTNFLSDIPSGWHHHIQKVQNQSECWFIFASKDFRLFFDSFFICVFLPRHLPPGVHFIWTDSPLRTNGIKITSDQLNSIELRL